ncbi:MAG: hypothetical protein WCD88_09995, partial [Desulfobacterales bacterium]
MNPAAAVEPTPEMQKKGRFSRSEFIRADLPVAVRCFFSLLPADPLRMVLTSRDGTVMIGTPSTCRRPSGYRKASNRRDLERTIEPFGQMVAIHDFHLKKESRMNIYVGNLAFTITEDELRQAFEAFGKVDTATIIKDKYSGQSKGFGFVEMPSGDEAQAAIEGLNGKDLKG